MKALTSLCMSVLMTSAMQAHAVNATDGKDARKASYPVCVPGMNINATTSQQLLGSPISKAVKYAPERVSADPATTHEAESYGWVMGPDGYYWHYTMKLDAELVNDYGLYKEYKYTGADVTVYDNYNKQVGSFSVAVPDTMFCNRIQFYGPVTKKLFDNNDKTYEIMCDLHHAKNGVSYSVTRAYSVESGAIEFDKKGSGVIFDASTNSFNTFQRLIITQEDLLEGEGDQAKEYTTVDIYKSAGYGGDGCLLEKSFKLDQSKLYYMQGTYLNCYQVNGEPYFVFSEYEQPWPEDTDSEDYNDIKQRKNNNLVLRTYGMARPEGKYSKELTLIDSIKVNGDVPEGFAHRTLGFGALGYNDLSQGIFSADGDLNYVIAAYDYVVSQDADVVTFSVYNSKGEKVKDIIKNASSSWWKTLSSVPGKEDQIAFLQTIGDGDAASEQITLIDLPSCKQATVLPYMVEGNKISTTLDRKATNANSYGYQYVVSLAQGEQDETGNVIAPIAWINPNGTIDHKDAMNLGANGEYFTPLINETSLNPYIFDTDDAMEYVYLAKKRRTDGSNKIDNVLEVAKADGTIIRSFESNDTRRVIEPSVFPVDADGKYQLVVVMQNQETNNYEMNFYELPFTKFSKGGDGTKESPYMVSSTGDLMLMGQDKEANYKLANDIDMTEAGLWNPVNDFKGSLDGDGHTIFNMYINSQNARAGLFSTLSYGASVKNLNFIDPTIQLTSNNAFVGVVAGNCTTDSEMGKNNVNACENVHVLGANISGEGSPMVGGIIGQASLFGHIKGCSFQGTINVPNSDTGIGGIVGGTQTSSSVYACSANITANAAAKLGGIAGELAGDSKVTDCVSNGSLTAGNTIGGIAGYSSRAKISKCISNATIKANNPSKWSKYAAGGIVGELEASVSESADAAITNCLATGSIYMNNTIYDSTVDRENRIHAIVGSSTEYEPKDVEEKFDETIDDWVQTVKSYFTEKGLSNNYTTTDLTTNTESTLTDGKHIAASDLKKDFFQDKANFYGDDAYAYGKTIDTPWKGNKIPVLYFDNEPVALTISHEKITLGLNDPVGTFTATIYGVDDASDIDVVSSSTKVAEVTLDKTEGNVATIKVTAKKVGQAKINITYGSLTATCAITIMNNFINGVEDTEAGSFKVSVANGLISAENAAAIRVYSLDGTLAAQSDGSAISTAALAEGVYVVTATDKAGRQSTSKFAIK